MWTETGVNAKLRLPSGSVYRMPVNCKIMQLLDSTIQIKGSIIQVVSPVKAVTGKRNGEYHYLLLMSIPISASGGMFGERKASRDPESHLVVLFPLINLLLK